MSERSTSELRPAPFRLAATDLLYDHPTDRLAHSTAFCYTSRGDSK